MKFKIWNEYVEILKDNGDKIVSNAIFMNVNGKNKHICVNKINYICDVKQFVNLLIEEFMKINND